MTTEILLLNGSYEPLRIITAKKAVDLMLRGVVEKVDGVATKFQTPSTIFEVPSVLRLKYYVNVPHRTIHWTRRNIMKRDRWTCAYCGIHLGEYQDGVLITKEQFTVDHVIPQSAGGKNTWGNTVCACYRCNHRKANRQPHEAGMHLRWEPKRPRTNYLVISGEIPTEWKVYIERKKK